MNQGLALVTGATGFVGANLVRLLLEKGYAIRVLTRPSSDRRNLPESGGLEIVEGDLRHIDSVRKAVRGCAQVFHVAADYRFWAPDPKELYETNVEGTRHLLQAAADEGVRKFVHTSTAGTIGLADQPDPCHERSPRVPGQFCVHYKKSKLQAENLALAFGRQGLPVVVVNPSAPIGPWDRKPTPTGKIIVDFIRGRLPAYLNAGFNFIHVRDVAMGHVFAAERGVVGDRYILGHRNLSMLDFLKVLAGLAQKRVPRWRIPYGIAWAAGAISTRYSELISKRPPFVPLEAVKMAKHSMFFDAGKAVRELGLPQTPVEQAAADALEWFSQNGYFGEAAVSRVFAARAASSAR